ncbi:SRPBCC family protein [Nocardiopsis potens]|uniref:SRPBCC family protein n=1 Tax=Nocardiopsis potens TaxID=1246458 RepID=UPI0003492154|nr:SRPBCC family protein [Nocardiopsis potens]
MIHVRTIAIDAPPAEVWRILSEVGLWPEWLPTAEWIQVEGGPLHEGQRVRLKQPDRAPVGYRVAEVRPGEAFTWGRSGPLYREQAGHRVEPDGAGGSLATLAFRLSGPLGDLAGRIGAEKVRGMVEQEAAALKERAEAGRARRPARDR